MGIYLDYNASTPIDEQVLNVMVGVYRNSYGNADSRTHNYGENARKIVEDARKEVARLLNVKADEVFFTSGATESDNIAILGLQNYAEKINKKHIVTTAIEHKAVLEPIRYLESKGFEVTYINPDISGRVSAELVLSAVREDTLLVSVMHANNETGIIQPVKEIGEVLSEKTVLFHIDAAQSCGKLVEELKTIKYDMLSVSAHKMYGPQGIGALILRKKRYKLPPVSAIMFGGKQENGMRPGTLPVALIAGFDEACKIAEKNYRKAHNECVGIKQNILDAINLSGVEYSVNGELLYCMPNTINISFHGVNSEALMLASKQYCGISNGSACNSNSYEPSYVLTAMGVDKEIIRSAVRISWGAGIDVLDDVKHLLDVVKSLI